MNGLRTCLHAVALLTLISGLLPGPTPAQAAPDGRAARQLPYAAPNLTAAVPYWPSECADCPRYIAGMSDRYLRVDAAGALHLAYGGDRLYYLRHDGGGSLSEVLDDSPGAGWSASLSLDAAGRPHVAWVGGWPDYKTRYAYRDEAGWHIETVDATGDRGSYASLALDRLDRPHLAYTRRAGDTITLTYARKEADHTWLTEVITQATGPNVDLESPSLALASDNSPRVSYHNISPNFAGTLRYAARDAAGRWQIVELSEGGGDFNSLALDASNRPHIGYSSGADSPALRYAHWNGASWINELLDRPQNGYAGFYSSLVVDPAGRPHISYQACLTNDQGPCQLRHAYKEGVAWTVEVVQGSGPDVGTQTTIALDTYGRLHIGEYDGSDGTLRHTYHDGSAWSAPAPLDSADQVGGYASLRLDGEDRPHLAYRATYWFLADRIQYAYRQGDAWVVETVPQTAGPRNSDIALALGPAGTPYISFCSGQPGSSDKALQVAWKDGAGWHTDTVTASLYCRSTSIAVDGQGYPHVAFYQGLSSLRYAYRDAGGWHVETVAQAGSLYNAACSLALDSAGRPHIGYYHNSNRDAMYALRDGGTWHIEAVDSADDAGLGLSLALDGQGRPRMAYGLYTAPTMALKYAAYDGGAWQIGTLETGLGWEFLTSLAVDAQGHPHLAYHTGRPTYYLRYAQNLGGGWTTEVVADRGHMGTYASVAVGQDGVPRIAYYDQSNRDVRYAVRGECTPLEGATIHGPEYLLAGEEGTYSATYTPENATAPVALEWDNGTTGATATYSWDEPGTHTITLTAMNPCSQVGAAFAVEVCLPVAAAAISGPAVLVIGQPGNYAASYTPPNATLPVTFTWDNGTVGPNATYTWDEEGTYTVTITAANPCGLVSASFPVTVRLYTLWLPLILRQP